MVHGVTENIGFNSLYITDLDESEFATHFLIMLFETSSMGSQSKAYKSWIYCPIGDWESVTI